MEASRVVLKKGRERSLLRRHPWIFSGAIAKVEGHPAPGETVSIAAADGRPLGRGAYSPASQITVRVWSFAPDEPIGPAFFAERIARAVDLRRALLSRPDLDALRLVHGESDGLPGVIADRYGDFLVVQFLTAGAEHWRGAIVEALATASPCRGIFERSDADVRGKEGLPERTGLLSGTEPPAAIEIREGRCRFLVDVRTGHKTGFYLDQRDSRAALAAQAAGATVLNAFSYSGGFGIAALVGGAKHVTHLDASATALALAERHAALNGLAPSTATCLQGDAFAVLRQMRDQGHRFDIIVLDPPKFAESRGHLERAARGYKDINLLGFKLLAPGGRLFTFSCSGLLDPALFQKVVADAALDAGREAAIIGRLGQGADHPTLLSFPEGTYLKGLICRAV